MELIVVHFQCRVLTRKIAVTRDKAVVVSWFNPSQQLSTTQPLPPPPSQWDGEEGREKKKVKLVG